MELEEKVARFQEIERRGLLDRLTQRQQAGWAEYKRRHNLPDYQTKEETFDWSKVTPEMREQIAANNRDYDNQSYAGRMVKDAVTGAGEGIVSGLYNAANGATLGGAGWLDRKTGGNFTALDERLQRRADETGAGFFNKAAKLAAEIGGNVAGAGGAITKGLTKTGLKGMGLGLTDAAVQGGIYGTTSADNWADVPANAAFGAAGGAAFGAALSGAFKGIGKIFGIFRKDPQKGMEALRKKFGDEQVNAWIKEARDKNLSILEVVDERGLDVAQMARQQTPEAKYTIAKNLKEMDSQNTQNTQKFFDDMFGERSGYETVDDIAQAAKQEAQPLYNELESMGDLETYEITQKFKKLPMAEREILGIRTPEEYENILRQQADKAGVTLFDYGSDGINHFLKDSQRRAVVNTLDETLRNPDISGWRNSPKGVPTKYTMKKYIGDKGKESSSLYDIVMQQKENEIFNKFPRSSARDAAKNFKAPVSDLSAKDSLLNDMGTNPSSFGNDSISKIATLVKENDVVADTIGKVKRSLSSLKKASDTDARVILETRKVLSKQTKSSDPSVAYQAKNALKELDPVLKDIFGGKLEQANKIYEDAYKFQDAFDFGKNKVINQETSPQVFAREFDKLMDKEKKAVELGLKEKMLQITQGRTQESGWKLSPFAQQKIRRVLGEKEGGRLIDYANARMKAAQNRNAARGGSTTAQNQKLRDDVNFAVDALEHPTGIIGKALRRVPWNDARNRGIANIMTNPNVEVAERAFTEVTNPQGWEAVYQALTNPKSSQAKYNAALAAYLSNGMLNY